MATVRSQQLAPALPPTLCPAWPTHPGNCRTRPQGPCHQPDHQQTQNRSLQGMVGGEVGRRPQRRGRRTQPLGALRRLTATVPPRPGKWQVLPLTWTHTEGAVVVALIRGAAREGIGQDPRVTCN